MPLTKAVDNLCLYDPDFKYIADRFLSAVGGSSDIFEIKSMDDLKTAFNSYRSVKFLEIVLHGSSGTLYMGKMQMAGYYLATLAKTNPKFLHKDARILFDSCSIGQGSFGDQFMNRLGAEWLTGKGGIIGASTVDNMTLPLLPWTSVYMLPFSDGRLKVKKYGVDGNLQSSTQLDRYGNKN